MDVKEKITADLRNVLKNAEKDELNPVTTLDYSALNLNDYAEGFIDQLYKKRTIFSLYLGNTLSRMFKNNIPLIHYSINVLRLNLDADRALKSLGISSPTRDSANTFIGKALNSEPYFKIIYRAGNYGGIQVAGLIEILHPGMKAELVKRMGGIDNYKREFRRLKRLYEKSIKRKGINIKELKPKKSRHNNNKINIKNPNPESLNSGVSTKSLSTETH